MLHQMVGRTVPWDARNTLRFMVVTIISLGEEGRRPVDPRQLEAAGGGTPGLQRLSLPTSGAEGFSHPAHGIQYFTGWKNHAEMLTHTKPLTGQTSSDWHAVLSDSTF